jgi:hypothetical protein
MAERHLADVMECPEYAAGLARMNKARRHGDNFIDTEAFDVVGQGRFNLKTISLPQLAVTADIHARLCLGVYAHFRVHAFGEPSADVERDENAAMLSTLEKPFVALVDLEQNMAPQDGYLKWTAPIRAGHGFGASFFPPCVREKPESVHGPIWLKPRKLPLEIGSTMPSRTFAHLRTDGGVARWPYGHDMITVLVALDRESTSAP